MQIYEIFEYNIKKTENIMLKISFLLLYLQYNATFIQFKDFKLNKKQ